MKTQIFRLMEAKGFILYEREKTKVKGYAAWDKYFINNDIVGYCKEFKTLAAAKKEFNNLTNDMHPNCLD